MSDVVGQSRLTVCHFYPFFLSLETIFVTFSKTHFSLCRYEMTLKYDRLLAVCPRAEEHCKLRPPLHPPGLELPSSPGPFKIDELSNTHRF